jgi:putative FmdB family regulatory protein
MPLYEYKCNDCGTCFELQRKISERDDLANCPKCNSKKITRGLGNPSVAHYVGLHFKSQIPKD